MASRVAVIEDRLTAIGKKMEENADEGRRDRAEMRADVSALTISVNMLVSDFKAARLAGRAVVAVAMGFGAFVGWLVSIVMSKS